MVVAHQGGWDEILLVAAPILVLAALLWLANRRAEALRRHDPDGAESVADAADGDRPG